MILNDSKKQLFFSYGAPSHSVVLTPLVFAMTVHFTDGNTDTACPAP